MKRRNETGEKRGEVKKRAEKIKEDIRRLEKRRKEKRRKEKK